MAERIEELIPEILITNNNSTNQTDLEDSIEVFFSDSLPRPLKMNKLRKYGKLIKIYSFVLVWLVCSVSFMLTTVKKHQLHQISIPKGVTKNYLIWEELVEDKIHVTLVGALLPPYYQNLSTSSLQVWVQLLILNDSPKNLMAIEKSEIISNTNVSEVWSVPLVTEQSIGVVPEVTYKKTFKLKLKKLRSNHSNALIQMQLKTNLKANFPISMEFNLQPINTDNGIIYAALILVGLYLVIIFDLIHKTLAAMLASTTSVAILAALNARPTMSEIISWIDVETLLLLFSMMILVTILGETGIFDYMSVIAYKVTNGRIWPLINILCIITALLSCFFDNVTTTLLITPVTIKLCEVMKLNPVSILIYMLIFGNVGGAITPIGDPPNVIIASNSAVVKSGVHFGTFTLHMGIGVAVAFIAIYVHLRCLHKNMNFFKYSEPRQIEELKREIAVWRRAAASVSSYSKEEGYVKESLLKRSSTLLGILKFTELNANNSEEFYTTNLKDLQKKYPIKDKALLIKSGITLFLLICVFFLHSFPAMNKLGLGWSAFLAALLLLLLYDDENMEGILSRIEWSTLLFFASLFILMEAVSRLGLIDWVGVQTQNVIMSVKQESRLTVALILILWVSGFASAFVDNLPLTTMMIRIATNLADNSELCLPLQPLIWALSFGACFGGNGTLLGSTSNIICAGVAEQHGYRFTFLQFTKIGFPVMITSMSAVTIYLIICHVVFNWH